MVGCTKARETKEVVVPIPAKLAPILSFSRGGANIEHWPRGDVAGTVVHENPFGVSNIICGVQGSMKSFTSGGKTCMRPFLLLKHSLPLKEKTFRAHTNTQGKKTI